MKDVVLILTNTYDESPKQVIVELERSRANYYRFDTDTCPLGKLVSISLREGAIGGGLKDERGQQLVSWADVKTVWYRRPRVLKFQHDQLSEGYLRFIQAETSTALWALWTTLDAFWVNHPLNTILLEHNKLYQQKVARQLGLDVPDTLITNDPEELAEFCGGHGGTIAVKQLRGGLVAREKDLQTLFIYTHKVSQHEIYQHKADIRLAPILAQEYVPKRMELRVTIVGKRIFACAIHSQEDEWTKHDWRRYPDLSRLKHETYALPDDIESKLVRLMDELGLNFGAVDLILTPDQRYVFLEVNPSGQWGWIEELTGMRISSALCHLLCSGTRVD